jgi:hypothetical protein
MSTLKSFQNFTEKKQIPFFQIHPSMKKGCVAESQSCIPDIVGQGVARRMPPRGWVGSRCWREGRVHEIIGGKISRNMQLALAELTESGK